MERTDFARQRGLLISRGIFYVIIGVSLFLFANSFSSMAAQLIGGFTIVAGVLGGIYAFRNLQTDRNSLWELLRSLFDIGFGIAFITYSRGSVDLFLGTLGFWAVLYAFLEAIQAMYIFMLSTNKQPTAYSGNFLHFLSVLIAGALAYLLVMVPGFLENVSILLGLFPVVLGAIIILRAIRQSDAKSA
ncbi:hypothetical protein GCM10027592_16170 [Spirosoma flavus]